MESENILFSARSMMPSIQSSLEISTSSSISSGDVSINTGFKGAVTLKGGNDSRVDCDVHISGGSSDALGGSVLFNSGLSGNISILILHILYYRFWRL